jgi:hypothetical protein
MMSHLNNAAISYNLVDMDFCAILDQIYLEHLDGCFALYGKGGTKKFDNIKMGAYQEETDDSGADEDNVDDTVEQVVLDWKKSFKDYTAALKEAVKCWVVGRRLEKTDSDSGYILSMFERKMDWLLDTALLDIATKSPDVSTMTPIPCSTFLLNITGNMHQVEKQMITVNNYYSHL